LQLRQTVRFKDGTSITFNGAFIMRTTVDGGPFQFSVGEFVDDKGNTTTDSDIPVWTADGVDADGNPLATLEADPGNPQGVIMTLSGKKGALQLSAAFGDQDKLGTPGNYLLTDSLNIAPGLAVSGRITGTGPGLEP
jgi:hypothetical protein